MRRSVMEELKRNYIVDEQNHRVAVQIDIETFNRIEEILENYALVRLMKENVDENALTVDEAIPYYESMEKAD
jgi:hypothetical protein